MTRIEYKEFISKAEFGVIADELNPAFVFTLTFTELLKDIASGKINAQELAKRELETRGLDIDGNWVGFGKIIV